MGLIASFSFALAFIGSLYLLLFYQASPIPMGIGIGLLIVPIYRRFGDGSFLSIPRSHLCQLGRGEFEERFLCSR
jgi:hypothetical protein